MCVCKYAHTHTCVCICEREGEKKNRNHIELELKIFIEHTTKHFPMIRKKTEKKVSHRSAPCSGLSLERPKPDYSACVTWRVNGVRECLRPLRITRRVFTTVSVTSEYLSLVMVISSRFSGILDYKTLRHGYIYTTDRYPGTMLFCLFFWMGVRYVSMNDTMF